MTETRHNPLRWLVSLVTGGYALGLLLFLVLKLIFNDTLWWVALLSNFTPVYFAALIVLLPLGLVTRAKRGVLLMLPLALVGGIWYGRLYLPKTPAVASADNTKLLRVVSLNVWGDNPDLTSIENWLRDQAADVVVTVELPPVWNGGVSSLRETYEETTHVSPTSRYWGSTIFTRRPVVSTDLVDFGGVPQQRVVIDVDGQQVAIYGVHLLLPMGNEPHIRIGGNFYMSMVSMYDDTARNAQIHALIAHLQDEPLPYVVAGDFNMSDQSAVYGDLAAAMGDSFREVGTGLGTSWPMLKASFGLPTFIPPVMRLDYIWHSAGFRAVDAAVGPFVGSDHLPMLATLALE